jgi:hypothetical protein
MRLIARKGRSVIDVGLHWEREDNMAEQERTKTIVPPDSPERWGGVDPKPPPHFDEPKDPVLLEYVHDGRTAIITSIGRKPATRSRRRWVSASPRSSKRSRRKLFVPLRH